MVVHVLGKQHVVRLLKTMGISEFDLVHESTAGDGAARRRQDETLVTILKATDGNLESVEAFVKDLPDNKELPRHLEERRARRQRVQKNRDLGGRVETLVREALEENGFTVTHTGVGHDFEVERDWLEPQGDEDRAASVPNLKFVA